MAYINKVHITLGDSGQYQLEGVKSLTIKSSWKNTVESCKIELPDLKKQMDKNLKAGDKVTVALSMSTDFEADAFKNEFSGYIARIKNTIPFTLHCENEAYSWKREKAISKFYKEIALKDLLNELFGDAVTITDSTPELTLKKFKMNRVTPYEVLDKLKKEYLLTAYFREGKLLVGTQYLTEKDTPEVLYHLDGDRGNIVKDDLTYKSKDSIKLKARVISIMKDGTKLEFTEGDSDGAERTLHYKDISDEDELREAARKQLEKLKQDTVEGSIETFGLPYVQHSYLAALTSEKYSNKNGTFFIDEVETSFSTSGFRRKLKLGKKMS